MIERFVAIYEMHKAGLNVRMGCRTMANRMFVFLNDDLFPPVAEADLRPVISQWWVAKQRRPGTRKRNMDVYLRQGFFRHFFSTAHAQKRDNKLIEELDEGCIDDCIWYCKENMLNFVNKRREVVFSEEFAAESSFSLVLIFQMRFFFILPSKDLVAFFF